MAARLHAPASRAPRRSSCSREISAPSWSRCRVHDFHASRLGALRARRTPSPHQAELLRAGDQRHQWTDPRAAARQPGQPPPRSRCPSLPESLPLSRPRPARRRRPPPGRVAGTSHNGDKVPRAKGESESPAMASDHRPTRLSGCPPWSALGALVPGGRRSSGGGCCPESRAGWRPPEHSARGTQPAPHPMASRASSRQDRCSTPRAPPSRAGRAKNGRKRQSHGVRPPRRPKIGKGAKAGGMKAELVGNPIAEASRWPPRHRGPARPRPCRPRGQGARGDFLERWPRRRRSGRGPASPLAWRRGRGVEAVAALPSRYRP